MTKTSYFHYPGTEGGVTRSESSSCPTPPCSPEGPSLEEEQQLASDDSLVTIAITNTAVSLLVRRASGGALPCAFLRAPH